MTVPFAFNAVEEVFAAFPWLSTLGRPIYDLLTQLVKDDTPPEVIASQIRDTDAYKSRFTGMAMRTDSGFKPITEAEYLDLENSYRSQLRSYQLLGFYDGRDQDFEAFAANQIGKDISAAEFSRRLDRGFAQVYDSRSEIQDAFQQFYGVAPTDNALMLYFLDPNKGINEIENQVAAAIVGGEALAYGLNISRTRAEMFASQGVTQQFARKGFANVAKETPLIEQLANIHRFTPLSQKDLEQVFFNEDPTVIAERARIFNTAIASFTGPVSRQSSAGLTELLDINQTV